jgi:hypothetical protein
LVVASADLVLGHHQQMLRGVEFHQGRPTFYGLGHYVFDLPDLPRRIAEDDAALDRYRDPYLLGPRDGYPLLPFHPRRPPDHPHCELGSAGRKCPDRPGACGRRLSAAGRVRDHRPRGVTMRPVTSDPAGNDGGIN